MHRPTADLSLSARLCWSSLGPWVPLWGAVWFALWAGPAGAAETRIELRDGSVLQGELVSAGGGTYRIRSATLGEIAIKESDVAAVRPLTPQGTTAQPAPSGNTAASGLATPGAIPAPATGPSAGGLPNLSAIQQQLLSDPGTLNAIMALKDDPEIQAALADPALVQRLIAGDTGALLTDPRILRLMARPEIQSLLGRALRP